KTAARIGAVVMCATTPPGRRTDRDAAVSVTPIQKRTRTRSSSPGPGTLIRRSTSAPAQTTRTTTRNSLLGMSGRRTAREYGEGALDQDEREIERGPVGPRFRCK